MARGDQGAETKAERPTKAERRQARAARKRGPGQAAAAMPEAPGEDASPEERIEWRLARVEAAVAAQSERTEQLLEKVDATLREGPESATADEPTGKSEDD